MGGQGRTKRQEEEMWKNETELKEEWKISVKFKKKNRQKGRRRKKEKDGDVGRRPSTIVLSHAYFTPSHSFGHSIRV